MIKKFAILIHSIIDVRTSLLDSEETRFIIIQNAKMALIRLRCLYGVFFWWRVVMISIPIVKRPTIRTPIDRREATLISKPETL